MTIATTTLWASICLFLVSVEMSDGHHDELPSAMGNQQKSPCTKQHQGTDIKDLVDGCKNPSTMLLHHPEHGLFLALAPRGGGLGIKRILLEQQPDPRRKKKTQYLTSEYKNTIQVKNNTSDYFTFSPGLLQQGTVLPKGLTNLPHRHNKSWANSKTLRCPVGQSLMWQTGSNKSALTSLAKLPTSCGSIWWTDTSSSSWMSPISRMIWKSPTASTESCSSVSWTA